MTLGWIERGAVRKHPIERGQDEIGIAKNVSANLQDGHPPVSARQRTQQRTRGQARNVDRAPRDSLEAKADANLFREWRKGVVMQDRCWIHSH